MKKSMIASCCLLAITLLLTGAAKKDKAITKEKNGVYVVNTTTIGNDIVGFESTTPLKVYIKK